VQKAHTDDLEEVEKSSMNIRCYTTSVKMNFGVEYPSAFYDRYTDPRPDSSAPSSSLLTGSTLILK